MIPKTLKVRVCFDFEYFLKYCFQQIKYFINTFLTFSDNKRFTISFFINPFQCRILYRKQIKCLVFMWNATLGWNWLNIILRQQQQLLLSYHALKNLYLLSKSIQPNLYVAAIIFSFKDAENNGIICAVWIVNISNLNRYHENYTTMVATNFNIQFIVFNKLGLCENVVPHVWFTNIKTQNLLQSSNKWNYTVLTISLV